MNNLKNSQVVFSDLNKAASLAVAETLSYGTPFTLLTYASSNPPNPTFSSASTSNGFDPDIEGFHVVSTVLSSASVFDAGSDDDWRTTDEEQNGIKDEYDGISATRLYSCSWEYLRSSARIHESQNYSCIDGQDVLTVISSSNDMSASPRLFVPHPHPASKSRHQRRTLLAWPACLCPAARRMTS